jgi:hypothetical protein
MRHADHADCHILPGQNGPRARKRLQDCAEKVGKKTVALERTHGSNMSFFAEKKQLMGNT